MSDHFSLYRRIAVWLFLSFPILGQNVIALGNSSGWISDTIPLSISISNTDTIVAFQTDFIIPPNFQILTGSARLSQRSNGHILSFSRIDSNKYRIIAFSLEQLAFSGNSGEVFSVDAVLPGPAGSYPIRLENSILSNPQSVNVITGSEDGLVTVIDNTVRIEGNADNGAGEFKLFQNYPNPANPGTSVIFYSPSSEFYKFRVFSIDGTEVYSISEVCRSGYNHLHWEGKNTHGQVLTSGIYVYSIVLKDRSFVNKLLLLR